MSAMPEKTRVATSGNTLKPSHQVHAPAPAPAPAPGAGEDRPYYSEHQDGPSMEPWLWGVLAAFVPAALAVLLPEVLRTPLFIVSGVILAGAVVALIVQEIRNA